MPTARPPYTCALVSTGPRRALDELARALARQGWRRHAASTTTLHLHGYTDHGDGDGGAHAAAIDTVTAHHRVRASLVRHWPEDRSHVITRLADGPPSASPHLGVAATAHRVPGADRLLLVGSDGCACTVPATRAALAVHLFRQYATTGRHVPVHLVDDPVAGPPGCGPATVSDLMAAWPDLAAQPAVAGLEFATDPFSDDPVTARITAEGRTALAPAALAANPRAELPANLVSLLLRGAVTLPPADALTCLWAAHTGCGPDRAQAAYLQALAERAPTAALDILMAALAATTDPADALAAALALSSAPAATHADAARPRS